MRLSSKNFTNKIITITTKPSFLPVTKDTTISPWSHNFVYNRSFVYLLHAYKYKISHASYACTYRMRRNYIPTKLASLFTKVVLETHSTNKPIQAHFTFEFKSEHCEYMMIIICTSNQLLAKIEFINLGGRDRTVPFPWSPSTLTLIP